MILLPAIFIAPSIVDFHARPPMGHGALVNIRPESSEQRDMHFRMVDLGP
jgi:hypothetical protein